LLAFGSLHLKRKEVMFEGSGAMSGSGRLCVELFFGARPPSGQDGGAGWAGPWTCLKPILPSCAPREKWCHMTQEERDDSQRFNENITFGQLG
jgi:hypothetical protein